MEKGTAGMLQHRRANRVRSASAIRIARRRAGAEFLLLLLPEGPNVSHEQLDLAGIEGGLEGRHIALAILDLRGDLRVGELLNGIGA